MMAVIFSHGRVYVACAGYMARFLFILPKCKKYIYKVAID